MDKITTQHLRLQIKRRLSPLEYESISLYAVGLNYHEIAKRLGRSSRSIDRALVSQIVVGDNGSTDRTVEQARGAGATVIVEPDRGYGAACAAALSLLDPLTDVVVFMDADGSDAPSEMAGLVVIGCL